MPLTTNDVASRLGVQRQWVWRLVQSGRIPAVKQGRDWLISEDDLAAFQQQARKPGRPRTERGTTHGSH